MRRALVVVALSTLAAAAPPPAHAYVRTTSDLTGAPLFWALPAIPYQVNADGALSPSCSAGPTGDPAIDAVRAGFSAWHARCADGDFADLDLVYAGTIDEIRTGLDGTGENIVVFRHGWCSDNALARADPCYTDPDLDCGNVYDCFDDQTPSDQSIVALTSVLYDPTTGRVFDADIQVNGWDGSNVGGSLKPPPTNGWYFTCGAPPATICSTYGQADCSYVDLQNTITHEAGHVVGLAHNPDPTTTMSPSTAPGEVSKRILSPDDVAGVCAIYPPPSGCSSAGGSAGAVALLLAAVALRRGRRSSGQHSG